MDFDASVMSPFWRRAWPVLGWMALGCFFFCCLGALLHWFARLMMACSMQGEEHQGQDIEMDATGRKQKYVVNPLYKA